MFKFERIKIFHLLFILVILIGLAVRLAGLGDAPLSESEARLAVASLQLAEGGFPVGVSGSPGYLAVTGFLFFIFGESNFSARLVALISGLMLMLVPFVLRRRLGQVPALVMTVGLALDPFSYGLSTYVNSTIMVLGPFLLALSLRIANQGSLTSFEKGITAALLAFALLSGPKIYTGIVVILLTAIAVRILGFEKNLIHFKINQSVLDSRAFKYEILIFAASLVLIGSLFLRYPQGIAGLAQAFPAYLIGWLSEADVSIGQLLISFGVYHGFVGIFALIHVLRSWRKNINPGKEISVWLLVSFFVVVLYPARDYSDLVWVLIPTWILASLEIGYWVSRSSLDLKRVSVLAAIIVFLLISLWTNLAGLSYVVPGDDQFTLRLLIIVGTLVLVGLSVSLAALSWSIQTAQSGVLYGVIAVMLIGLVAGIGGNSHRTRSEQRELWLSIPLAGHEYLLRQSLEEIGAWRFGASDDLSISIISESIALKWALKDFPTVDYGVVYPDDELPSVIITEENPQEFKLSSAYRGQPILWRVTPAWDRMLSADWMKWLLFREAPADYEDVIVWVRADLFLTQSESDMILDFPLDALDEPQPIEIVPLEDVEDLMKEK